MAILLRWTHRNSGSFTTKIFRSDTEFTPSTKPSEPIATLTNNEVQWSDTTVEFGKWYYYLIQISRGSIVLDSQVRMLRETIESPWGTNTNDPLLDNIIGGNYDFGYAGTTPWDSLYDNAGEEILRRCGYSGDFRGNYDRVVLGGRYFLIPVGGIVGNAKMMIDNNMFLGHRKPPLPTGLPAGSLGTNDPFIWKGRKWSVGLPRHKNEADIVPTALILAGTMKDANGFCTSKYLSQWELMSWAVNSFMFSAQVVHWLPKESVQNRVVGASVSTGIQSCEPLPGATQSNVLCYSVFNTNGNPTESQYNAASLSNIQLYPFIEYLGVA